ncbi:MAG TPA: HD domain-containing phosphohydrolase [Rhodocyclaceae bacterium]|nr:HD domain-containing phosphohydrolase [Rhodocyclaceae bacterium]
MKINLQRAITSLTSALDYVGVDEVHHAKRVALMVGAIAAEMGWSPAAARDMMYAGMLHDCGVSRVREHRQLSETLEWEGAEEHCLRGAEYLLACRPLAHFATTVRWHHTRWEDLLKQDLSERQRLQANLIFLADRADVLLVPYVAGQSLKNEILWEYPKIVGRLGSLKNSLFSPELIAAFARAATRESFWLSMDPAYTEEEIEERLRDSDATQLDTADALAVAGLFARTVDAKSSYTLEHSTRVARIARYLAGVCGITGEHLDQVEIAGLLHDIGKLRVPEEIIDKPGALTGQERAFVMRHSYDTGRLLKKVFPGLPIADWASMHHENLLGTGYPEHQPAANIPREARLISVADIFQALSQQRPYRARLSSAEVMAQLDELLRLGRLDPEMVEVLRTHLDRCYALAVD